MDTKSCQNYSCNSNDQKNLCCLPDTYRVDVKVALKDFIPKDLKPNDKEAGR